MWAQALLLTLRNISHCQSMLLVEACNNSLSGALPRLNSLYQTRHLKRSFPGVGSMCCSSAAWSSSTRVQLTSIKLTHPMRPFPPWKYLSYNWGWSATLAMKTVWLMGRNSGKGGVLISGGLPVSFWWPPYCPSITPSMITTTLPVFFLSRGDNSWLSVHLSQQTSSCITKHQASVQ